MSDELARLAAAAGMRLVPRRKLRLPMAQLVHALHHHAVDAVIDGGANIGQYAQALREEGWTGPILSIEADPDVQPTLAVAAAGDPRWHVLPALALGAAAGEAMLHRSAESDMSSLLAQSAQLETLSPSSAIVAQVHVAVHRLDQLSNIVDAPWRRLFVKLDLQGGEAAALDGLIGLLDRIVGLQVEMALVESYGGERLWMDTIAWLAQRGFSVHLLLPGYYERKIARHLQVDGVFFRDPPDPLIR